jgi:hypothetical protein
VAAALKVSSTALITPQHILILQPRGESTKHENGNGHTNGNGASKHLPRMFSLISERRLGDRRRSGKIISFVCFSTVLLTVFPDTVVV